MRAAARGRRHRDAALAVVVDHALVVVPKHVPAGSGTTSGEFENW